MGARCFQNGHFGRISSTLYFTVFRSFGGHASARRVSLEPCFRQAHCFVQGPLRFLPVPPNPTCAPSHIWGFPIKIKVVMSKVVFSGLLNVTLGSPDFANLRRTSPNSGRRRAGVRARVACFFHPPRLLVPPGTSPIAWSPTPETPDFAAQGRRQDCARIKRPISNGQNHKQALTASGRPFQTPPLVLNTLPIVMGYISKFSPRAWLLARCRRECGSYVLFLRAPEIRRDAGDGQKVAANYSVMTFDVDLSRCTKNAS